MLAHGVLAAGLVASERCVRPAGTRSQEDSANSPAQHKHTCTRCTGLHSPPTDAQHAHVSAFDLRRRPSSCLTPSGPPDPTGATGLTFTCKHHLRIHLIHVGSGSRQRFIDDPVILHVKLPAAIFPPESSSSTNKNPPNL